MIPARFCSLSMSLVGSLLVAPLALGQVALGPVALGQVTRSQVTLASEGSPGPDAGSDTQTHLRQANNPDSGNPDSGNPDSGNPDSGNPETATTDKDGKTQTQANQSPGTHAGSPPADETASPTDTESGPEAELGTRAGVPSLTEQLQELPAPWEVTSEQQAAVGKALNAWQAASSKVETLSGQMRYWHYDSLWNRKRELHGSVKYAKPGHWAFSLSYQRVAGKWVKLHDRCVWTYDGKAYWSVDDLAKTLEKHPFNEALTKRQFPFGPSPLDVTLRSGGQHISRHPAVQAGRLRLPLLLFDAEAFGKLYHIRPSDRVREKSALGQKEPVWLELAERFSSTGKPSWHRAEIMLDPNSLMIQGIKLHALDRQSSTTFAFARMTINQKDPFSGNKVTPVLPDGYTQVTVQPADRVATKPTASE